jgi:hypothetical protein
MLKRLLSTLVVIALLTPLILATGCAASPAHEMKMAPMSDMPVKVQNAPSRVREAYQFAIANPDALKNVPCYCGCGAIGHTSNYSCYYNEAARTFDEHALGCSVCVDIAQDVKKLTQEGRAPPQIHAAIVSAYSQFGPPNQ